jgi:hypothetical protein
MNEIHSYITSCKRGYLTQAELFRYYRQQEHDNAEIPYHLLGYRSLLDLYSVVINVYLVLIYVVNQRVFIQQSK